MKTATLPAVRVQPDLRADIERVLSDGESLSQFVESAVQAAVHQRTQQAEFVTRGMASLQKARKSGDYVDAGRVVDGLRHRLQTARAKQAADGR